MDGTRSSEPSIVGYKALDPMGAKPLKPSNLSPGSNLFRRKMQALNDLTQNLQKENGECNSILLMRFIAGPSQISPLRWAGATVTEGWQVECRIDSYLHRQTKIATRETSNLNASESCWTSPGYGDQRQ